MWVIHYQKDGITRHNEGIHVFVFDEYHTFPFHTFSAIKARLIGL